MSRKTSNFSSYTDTGKRIFVGGDLGNYDVYEEPFQMDNEEPVPCYTGEFDENRYESCPDIFYEELPFG